MMLSTTFSTGEPRVATFAEVVAEITPPSDKTAEEIMRASVQACDDFFREVTIPADAPAIERKRKKLGFAVRRRNELLKVGS